MEDTSMPQKDHTDVYMGDMPMDNEMMQMMSNMMDQMNDMEMTGDFDFDFANMMIMHHKGAIEMSEIEISKGTDAQLKSMAQTIINAQKAEIEVMEKFIKNFKIKESKIKDTKAHNELGETMTAMMDAMHIIKMTGNTDKDFAIKMIPHHQAAVKMANDELSHGKSRELKKTGTKNGFRSKKGNQRFESMGR